MGSIFKIQLDTRTGNVLALDQTYDSQDNVYPSVRFTASKAKRTNRIFGETTFFYGSLEYGSSEQYGRPVGYAVYADTATLNQIVARIHIPTTSSEIEVGSIQSKTGVLYPFVRIDDRYYGKEEQYDTIIATLAQMNADKTSLTFNITPTGSNKRASFNYVPLETTSGGTVYLESSSSATSEASVGLTAYDNLVMGTVNNSMFEVKAPEIDLSKLPYVKA